MVVRKATLLVVKQPGNNKLILNKKHQLRELLRRSFNMWHHNPKTSQSTTPLKRIRKQSNLLSKVVAVVSSAAVSAAQEVRVSVKKIRIRKLTSDQSRDNLLKSYKTPSYPRRTIISSKTK